MSKLSAVGSNQATNWAAQRREAIEKAKQLKEERKYTLITPEEPALTSYDRQPNKHPKNSAPVQYSKSPIHSSNKALNKQNNEPIAYYDKPPLQQQSRPQSRPQSQFQEENLISDAGKPLHLLKSKMKSPTNATSSQNQFINNNIPNQNKAFASRDQNILASRDQNPIPRSPEYPLMNKSPKPELPASIKHNGKEHKRDMSTPLVLNTKGKLHEEKPLQYKDVYSPRAESRNANGGGAAGGFGNGVTATRGGNKGSKNDIISANDAFKIPSSANIIPSRSGINTADSTKGIRNQSLANNNNNNKNPKNDKFRDEKENYYPLTYKTNKGDSKPNLNSGYGGPARGHSRGGNDDDAYPIQVNKKQGNLNKNFGMNGIVAPQEGGILIPCPEGCGRKFNPEVIEKHANVCKKVFQSKRKQFDSSAARMTEEQFQLQVKQQTLGKTKGGSNPSKPSATRYDNQPLNAKKKQKWKQQSEAFRAGLKAARGEKLTAEQQRQLNNAQQEDLIQCNYCGRRFNEKAAQRHISFCENKSKLDKVKQVNKPTSTPSNNILSNNNNTIGLGKKNSIGTTATMMTNNGGNNLSKNNNISSKPGSRKYQYSR